MRAPTAPLVGFAKELSETLPDVYWEASLNALPGAPDFQEWRARQTRANDVGAISTRLVSLDVEPCRSVVLTADRCVDPQVRQRTETAKPKGGLRKGEAFGLTPGGGVGFRIRSAVAKAAASAYVRSMPESCLGGFVTRAGVIERVGRTLSVDGGPSATLGRLLQYYPRRGGKTPVQPVTRDEAWRAMRACGVVYPIGHLSMKEQLDFYAAAFHYQGTTLILEDVHVNMHSDNGFPTLGHMDDIEAEEMVRKNMVRCRQAIEQAVQRDEEFGVLIWKRQMEDSDTAFVACRGKAKADLYTVDKIAADMLRFYNVLPRHVFLNMAVVTQPLERRARNILHDDYVRTAIGASLAHGGAHNIVRQMDRRLDDDGVTWLHLGDDSWVIFCLDMPDGSSQVIMFSVDCSSFDLTQHSAVTQQVHSALREELSKYDKAAADLWYAYARERVVVTAGSVALRWKHAGPSGMPLQSKVNDLLMEVYLSRLVRRLVQPGVDLLSTNLRKDVLNDHISYEAQRMGLTVRLEDYAAVKADSLMEALSVIPFKFVGYYWHVLEVVTSKGQWGKQVAVYADIPRMISQLIYPNSKWVGDRAAFAVSEAVRIASVVLSLGQPPADLRPAHRQLREYALGLLNRVLGRPHDADGAIRKYWQDNPVADLGVEEFRSLEGLKHALERGPSHIWGKEAPLPSTSELVPVTDVAISWRLGKAPPAAPPSVPYAHPPTWQNVGRPPPTAQWAADRPPRRTLERTGNRKDQQDYMRAVDRDLTGEWGADFDEESLEDEFYAMEDLTDSMSWQSEADDEAAVEYREYTRQQWLDNPVEEPLEEDDDIDG